MRHHHTACLLEKKNCTSCWCETEIKQVLHLYSVFLFPAECSDILDQKLQSNWSRGKGSCRPFEEIHKKTRGKKMWLMKQYFYYCVKMYQLSSYDDICWSVVGFWLFNRAAYSFFFWFVKSKPVFQFAGCSWGHTQKNHIIQIRLDESPGALGAFFWACTVISICFKENKQFYWI